MPPPFTSFFFRPLILCSSFCKVVVMQRVSAEEMGELERIMIEKYNVSEEALMELAGEKLAKFIGGEFSKDLKIAFILGKGGNGGDGAVCARRLNDRGFDVTVFTPYSEDELMDLTKKKFRGLEDEIKAPHFPSSNVYVDGLIGYGLNGEVREPLVEACEKINNWSSETVSIDVPTGLDVNEQKIDEKAVKPDYTVALGAVKHGVSSTNSGEIYLADIGIMQEAFNRLDLEAPSFEANNLIKAEE